MKHIIFLYCISIKMHIKTRFMAFIRITIFGVELVGDIVRRFLARTPKYGVIRIMLG